MPSFENMNVVEDVLRPIPIPRFALVRQHFDCTQIKDIKAAVRESMQQRGLYSAIKPGANITIAVGSRQIANLDLIVRETVDIVRERGANPFIMPAMGSHGGATAAGQTEILEAFGISEESMGCPILADMEVSQIGVSENGDPVYVASHLLSADGIIIINRVKPHPAFSGPIESGIVKMSVIGLGKQKGADYCHQRGLGGFSQRLLVMSKTVFSKLPVLFGIAILENAYDQTAKIVCIPADRVFDEEPSLQAEAKSLMPRIIPEDMDVLIVDRIGKNISGTGADPNVMCRFTSPYKRSDRKPPSRIVMLDLTEQTHGAAAGMGQADFITHRLYSKVDYGKIYINSLTSTLLQNSFTPLIMPNDKMAIQAAIKTCGRVDVENARIVRIKDTLNIGTMMISQAMLPFAEACDDLEIISDPFELEFDENGYLTER